MKNEIGNIELSIKQVKKGNISAFETIVDIYQQPIHKYIKYIAYGYRDVDDIVQEVFIKVYKNLNKYKLGTNFDGWLYKIAYNETMTVLKKRSKEPIVFTEVVPEVVFIEDFKDVSNPKLDDTLNLLEPDDRTLIFLRVYEALDYKEISSIMNLSASVLRKRFERAKEKFIRIYEEVSNDEKRDVR